MNSKERMALAMQGKIADRVPVMCQLALGHYFLNTDILPPTSFGLRVRGLPKRWYSYSSATALMAF